MLAAECVDTSCIDVLFQREHELRSMKDETLSDEEIIQRFLNTMCFELNYNELSKKLKTLNNLKIIAYMYLNLCKQNINAAYEFNEGCWRIARYITTSNYLVLDSAVKHYKQLREKDPENAILFKQGWRLMLKIAYGESLELTINDNAILEPLLLVPLINKNDELEMAMINDNEWEPIINKCNRRGSF